MHGSSLHRRRRIIRFGIFVMNFSADLVVHLLLIRVEALDLGFSSNGLVDLKIGVLIVTGLDLKPEVGSIDSLGPAVDVLLGNTAHLSVNQIRIFLVSKIVALGV